MRHGSLFSGIGGFDLASEWMGWENVFHCEWNEFGKQVLNFYWPNAISYDDITKTDFTIHRGRIDILTGGFPCQPYSMAGKRLGKEDERHLWPEMLRAIREIQPRYVVGENVSGLISWNGGMVFDEVQADLETAGYEVTPYVLPACGVNAPHRRDRVWFVAYRESRGDRRGLQRMESENGCQRESEKCRANDLQYRDNGEERITPDTNNTGTGIRLQTDGNGKTVDEGRERQPFDEPWKAGGATPDTDVIRHTSCRTGEGIKGVGSGNNGITEERGQQTKRTNGLHEFSRAATDTPCTRGREIIGKSKGESNVNDQISIPGNWNNFPTQPPVRSGNDGLSPELVGDSIFEQLGIKHPRKPFIGSAKHRNESIKAYGNTIVPQVAYQIFKAIAEFCKIPYKP